MSPWLNPLLFSRSNHYSDFCDSPSLCPARRQGCYIITHWVRRGIRPTSKWILVRFGTRWATTGTATTKLFLKTKGTPRNIPVLITCMSALFSSKYFLISTGISTLTHGLSRSVWLYFQIFGHFPNFFLLLISSLIPLWLENIVCYHLNNFKCVTICFMAQIVIFVNISCIFENIVYSTIKGCSVPYLSLGRVCWFFFF